MVSVYNNYIQIKLKSLISGVKIQRNSEHIKREIHSPRDSDRS